MVDWTGKRMEIEERVESENGQMPLGNNAELPITEEQVQVTEGDLKPPEFDDDAVATLVWDDYNRARQYIENGIWLLDWQEIDILYQSPVWNRYSRVEQGRPVRVSDFLLAKLTRTMARAMRRSLFAEDIFFFLKPLGKTTRKDADAWTALLMQLMKRMKFTYHAGKLLINTQTLMGTGIGKLIWCEKETIKKTRRRKKPAPRIELPSGSEEVPTTESDEFEVIEKKIVESWPAFEYRRLGTTLFDEKWCTPDEPDESAAYCVDVDYVNFSDLQRMRENPAYKNIPDEETLIKYFFTIAEDDASTGSQLEQARTSQGSMVTHAEGRNRTTTVDPLGAVLMILERWDLRTVKTILVYEGRKLTIRDEEHGFDSLCHPTATWWPIENCGYGMGIGKINGHDQRIRQGIKNECLKMLAYPMNAPLLVPRGENAPTQNVLQRLGGFFAVDVPAGGDVRKAAAYMEMPQIPADAWKMIAAIQEEAEQNSGASQQFQQGNIGGPGSSAARTATGANRISSMSDESVGDPVDSFCDGVIITTLKWLIECVKEKMPMQEIRDILALEDAQQILKDIDLEQLLNADFEVQVLAGNKLAARAGIQQALMFYLQVIQQPQLMQYMHDRGDTIDFEFIEDLMKAVSALQQTKGFVRKLTPEEMQNVQNSNPGAQKMQADLGKEKLRGQNKIAEIHEQGQVDMATKAAEIGMEHISEGNALIRAEGLNERNTDEKVLQGGL